MCMYVMHVCVCVYILICTGAWQVMKLMAIISVVFADFFMSINSGNGVFGTGNVK
jgi:hypothetical protein